MLPRHLLAGTGLVTLLGLALVSPALADNYGNGDGSAGLRPDNSLHTFCFAANYDGSNPPDAAGQSMTNLVNETTMTKERVDCGGDTDARFTIAQLGPFADGRWTCLTGSGNYCNHALLEFDTSNIGSPNDWRQTTCHEVGHSVGLAHGDGNDCMGTDPGEHHYNNHHQAHINNDRF